MYCCGGGIRTCPNVCRVEIFKHWVVMMLGRLPAHNLLGEVTDDMEGPWDGPPVPEEPSISPRLPGSLLPLPLQVTVKSTRRPRLA